MSGDNFYAMTDGYWDKFIEEHRKMLTSLRSEGRELYTRPVPEYSSLHQGLRYNSGKLPFELIPPEVEAALAKALKVGAEKYAPRNWEKGLSWTETYGSLRRHMNKWMAGEDYDEETGLPNVYLALANISFLVTFHDRGTGTDDRPN